MGKFDTSHVIVDATTAHTHTLVMLHGRGSNAERFAYDTSNPDKPGLLHARTSAGLTIQECFPGLRIIFPQATLRRCTARKRMKMNIWFDSASFEDPTIREDLHIQGINENARAITKILQSEAETLGWNKLFLGGLSEGCAMAAYTFANLEKISLAGFIGLSGWLPFQDQIDNILSGEQDSEQNNDDCGFSFEEEDDSIERPSKENEKPFQALAFMKEEILDSRCRVQDLIALTKTTLFFGHGGKDEVVPLMLGQRLANTFQTLGCKVQWSIYPDLGHWYDCPAEVDDIVAFLKLNM